MFDRLLPDVPLPYTYGKRCRGRYYLDSHCISNGETTRKTVASYIYSNIESRGGDSSLIFKPTRHSGFGRGVGKYSITSLNDVEAALQEWESENNVTIDNSKSTTNNNNGSYYCENTKDHVFLPSYKEVSTYDYGFSGDDSRRAITTDYSRAIGVCYMKDDNVSEGYYKFHAEYWTRSPDNSIFGGNALVSAVQQGGFINNMANESVNCISTAVRPAISLNSLS